MIESAAQYVLFLALAILPLTLLLRYFGNRSTGSERLVTLVLLGQGVVIAVPLFVGGSIGEPIGSSLIASRLSWLVLVGALVMGLVLVQPLGPGDPLARTVRFGLMAVIASQVLSSISSGQLPSLNVLLPSVLVAFILTKFSMPSTEAAVRLAQWAVMLPVTASAAAFALGFEWALSPDDERRLPNPFMQDRLTGVLPHPNALGPLAAVAFVLGVSRWSRAQAIPVLIAAFALWGSDTRTMILIMPVALAPMFLRRLDLPAGLRIAGIAFSAGILVIATWVWFSEAGATSTDVGTVNGRTTLWTQATDYIQANPLLGAGHRAFDQDFIASSGLSYAGQAHNQVFQTMAANGLIGLASLGFLLIVLGRLAISARVRTSGLSISLAIVGLAYLMVESPLRLVRWSPGLLVLSVVLAVGLKGSDRVRRTDVVHQHEAIRA